MKNLQFSTDVVLAERNMSHPLASTSKTL